MVGQFNGIATLLKQKCNMVKTFHSMAHRLELSVKNAVDTVNATSHFRAFVDELDKVYSMSPKNQAELNATANLLSLELLKFKRCLTYDGLSVRAVLRDYPALFQHSSDNAESESNRTSKEKSKYRGPAKKLQSWFLLSETCILKDGLPSIVSECVGS